ncbi:MAG: transposase [Dehalococcoidia bacterium]|nr:transposase [Dehalococcoidia bacterium]
MKGIPQGRYTQEFRQEAVKLVVEDKVSCREAVQRLSLAPSTLAY